MKSPGSDSKRGHSQEIVRGERFQFGANWKSFLSVVNDDRIHMAEESLKTMLDLDDLSNKKFLDIGCGSGLFSLAAKRLGAEVFSFDYDPESVKCASILKERYFPDDHNWQITQGSALDEEYVRRLGRFDIVYSWGVLHHTGDMKTALDNAAIPVAVGGKLFISIYNDQGAISQRWTKIKKLYCSGPMGKCVISAVFIPFYALRYARYSVRKHGDPFTEFREYKKNRGMSAYHDWIDWLGGYPFEVASLEEIENFYKIRGFATDKTLPANSAGCNQFVFRKLAS